MKILYVLHQFFPIHHTGTERLTLDIAKQVQRMGNFVSVLTYEPSSPLKNSKSSKFLYNSTNTDSSFEKIDNYMMKKEYQIESVPVIALKHAKARLGFQIFEPQSEKYLEKIVKDFDLVHFMHPMRFASLQKICKKSGIPTVLTLTDNWLLCPRGLVTSDYQLCDGPEKGQKCMSVCHYAKDVLTRYDEANQFFHDVDNVIAGSNFVIQTFKENKWDRKIDLVPFSVDYSHVKPVDDPKELVFGFMGTFIWHKGLHVLIQAFKKIEQKNIRLKIYGRGDERSPYVKEIINLAKGDDRIEFCGTFDYEDLPKVMSEISVLIIPSSYKENFPLVMQTSLAYQKPVIVSNIGGMPEVIKNGENGYLFEAGNTNQLAEQILKIANNPEEISNLKNGILLPPRIEQEALQYENIYRELLKPTNQ